MSLFYIKRLVIGLLIVGVGFGAATLTPQISYNPKISKLPLGLAYHDSPVRTAELFLQKVNHVPIPRAQQSTCFPVLSFDVVDLPWATVPARQITSIEWTSVHLSATTYLLLSLLDDDPVYKAVVEGLVVTEDGNKTGLTLTLWDYGLLTPWTIYQYGDGWKIDEFCYR
jgi:hypothetical protein